MHLGLHLLLVPSGDSQLPFREPQGMGLSLARRSSGELALGFPRFKSQLCRLPALQLWVSEVTSLSLSFLICKMGEIMQDMFLVGSE